MSNSETKEDKNTFIFAGGAIGISVLSYSLLLIYALFIGIISIFYGISLYLHALLIVFLLVQIISGFIIKKMAKMILPIATILFICTLIPIWFFSTSQVIINMQHDVDINETLQKYEGLKNKRKVFVLVKGFKDAKNEDPQNENTKESVSKILDENIKNVVKKEGDLKGLIDLTNIKREEKEGLAKIEKFLNSYRFVSYLQGGVIEVQINYASDEMTEVINADAKKLDKLEKKTK